MLTNTNMNTGSHFNLLLIEQPILQRRFEQAALSALDQRVGTLFTLNGMYREDTTNYIKIRLTYVRRLDLFFSDYVFSVNHHSSRGYRHAFNSLAVSSLIAAYDTEKHRRPISSRIIRHRKHRITTTSLRQHWSC